MPDDFAHSHLKTPWTAILAAQGGDPALRRQCLERLCQLYREPVRRYIQFRIGRPAGEIDDDADDLTQAFFLQFIEAQAYLDRVDPARGTFRAFLKTSVRNFVTDDFRRAGRRGAEGVLTRLSDGPDPDAAAVSSPLFAGARPGGAPCGSDARSDASATRPPPTPEEAYEREWAKLLVRRALEAFRQVCADRRLEHYYAVFERHRWRPEDFGHPTYEDSATALGKTEAEIRNDLSRAGKLFQKTIRELVRQTVADDAQVDDELRDLRRYLEREP